MNENASFLVLFLAPVKEYLEDDHVSEILINGPSQIYIERNGRLEETAAKFSGEAQLKAAAVNIAKSVDRQLDEAHPDLDARLPDGSRVHATIPPISRCGTILSIRKFKKEMLTMEKLEQFGSIPREGVLLLNAIVKLRKNVIVSGGTSSGKTSVLNALSGLIPENDRILVLEDASELQLQQKHCVYFETRKPDKNGQILEEETGKGQHHGETDNCSKSRNQFTDKGRRKPQPGAGHRDHDTAGGIVPYGASGDPGFFRRGSRRFWKTWISQTAHTDCR